ncbi:MAG: metallophosphoesterase [Ignavibacteriales bacterium]|nr:metallophosphoesterase [Ignavibacteriales bacterium]
MKNIKIRSLFLSVLIFVLAISQQSILYSQNENVVPKSAQALSELGKNFTFMIASDLGRNGYYDQKPVAEMMGEVATIAEPEFVAAIGDVHHFLGVKSVQDPLWQTNFEWIYKHPELMIKWYPVMGNHEYRGNTQAVIDYSNVSRRWIMPSRYYAKTFSAAKNVGVLLLFIDTAPIIDKYRIDSEEYPDAGKQSMERQLAWIDSTLGASKAKWKIVLGHHPIYAGTGKEEAERVDLQKRLQPLLDKNKVDISVGGHVHNFQHIHATNSNVDYFVNSSASLTRKVSPLQGELFGSSDSGFTLCTINETELIITFVNKAGEIIYQYKRTK